MHSNVYKCGVGDIFNDFESFFYAQQGCIYLIKNTVNMSCKI